MNRMYIMPKVILLTVFLILLTHTYTWYWLLLFLTVSFILAIAGQVIYVVVLAQIYLRRVNSGKFVSKEKIYTVVNRLISTVNRFVFMEVIVDNPEAFDPSKPYLVTPNHQSNADATVMMEVFKTPIFFASKFSMSKAPFIKDWMNLMGCVYLNKDDMRSQIIVMGEVEKKLRMGETAIIFPEGRRSYGTEMNEFKPGTFKMATKTGVDILPITINNVHQLRHHFPWKKTEVHVYFHQPIPYEHYKDLGTQEIANMVQDIVRTKIE